MDRACQRETNELDSKFHATLPCNHFVSASHHSSHDLPLANLSDVVYDANCYRYKVDR